MASSGIDSAKEEVFKPIENSQNADDMKESHGTRQDLTADTPVKAPGVMQRIEEEMQALASAAWAKITPSKKK